MTNVFRNKSVTVVGSGESGMSAIRLLTRLGAKPRCSTQTLLGSKIKALFKKRSVLWEEGGHTAAFLKDTDYLVVSPGVRPSSFPIRYCRRRHIPILSEIELASRVFAGRWVAVTGTNGKTTTSTLLAEILRRRRSCELCGNIGNAFSRSLIEKNSRSARVVEVSSFQLSFIDRMRPTVTVILNLSPNHLDWHRNLKEYYAAKMNIARNLSRKDTLVLNADDPTLIKHARDLKGRRLYFSKKKLRDGIYSEGMMIYRVRRNRRVPIVDLNRCHLRGDHHLENIMAATAAALLMGATAKQIQQTVDQARPLPHRLENLGEVRGVRFVNDSKSTTVQSTLAAIRSVPSDIVLVAGGRRKQKSFRSLTEVLERRVSRLVLYGETSEYLKNQFKQFTAKDSIFSFEEAVRHAYRTSRPGQTLLLSPMCSSFDQFSSYEERGNAFKRIFNELRRDA